MVANAGGANGLAASYADRVRALGYAEVEAANAVDRRNSSIVYWGPGWEDEARRLASELGIGATEPLPSAPIVLGRFDGDVWAVIGVDLQER